MIIHLAHQSQDQLFGGATIEQLTRVNVPASITEFEKEWSKRVSVAYPDADLIWVDRLTWVFGVEDNLTGDITQYIQQLAEELFDDGNIWMVESE